MSIHANLVSQAVGIEELLSLEPPSTANSWSSCSRDLKQKRTIYTAPRLQ